MRLKQRLSLAIKAVTNIHRPGDRPDIFLFATPRGGSTWLMEILASQPRMKFFDEPLNPRRLNVSHSGLFPDFATLMPDAGRRDVIIAFLRGLQSGRHAYMNPTPFRRNHRFFTRRAVFKIHEIEHLMADVERACHGMIVYLLRHPLATSISRETLPRLDLFLQSEFYSRLLGDPRRVTEIRGIAASGSRLQRSVVSWCFENILPLRQLSASWLCITYEELVLNPIQSCELLIDRLDLHDRRQMLLAFGQPAANIQMSREQTLAAMQHYDGRERRRRLVSKWRDQVSAQEEADAAHVLSAFGIDAYEAGRLLPHRRHLHFDNTAQLLSDAQ